MQKGFTIWVDAGVAAGVARRAKRLFQAIEKATPVPHRVLVIITNSMSLNLEDSELRKLSVGSSKHVVTGRFFSPEDRRHADKVMWPENCDSVIALPGRLEAFYRAFHNMRPRQSARWVFNNAALHEVIHYCQFRDKKRFSHDDIGYRIEHLQRRVNAFL